MISTNDTESNEYFRSYRNFGRVPQRESYTIEQEGFKFYMNNLNATIGLTQIDRYEDNLKTRKRNYNILKREYKLLPHDEKSSFYFATNLTNNANSIIINAGLVRHYPMLHKMEYYNNEQVLPNLERLHNKILNLPLYRKIEF
jgi:dTDP-4-amino-4,6-dideoxygalactose transaminase